MVRRYPVNIRWKFLTVMLLVAITPVLISAWLEKQSLSKLGADLAAESGKAINEQTRKALIDTNRHYAEILNRETNTAELLARLHAMRVKKELASELSPLELRGDFTGFKQTSIQAAEQSIFLAETGDAELSARQAKKLMRLESFYRTVQEKHNNLFHRQYVALESGLLSSFPALTDLPADFDPRNRSWYALQKAQQKLLWSPPHTDVASGKKMFNLTMPIQTPRGEFLGVAAIDIKLSSILSALDLPLRRQYDSRIMLGVLVNSEPLNEPSILIVSHTNEIDAGDWKKEPSAQKLMFDKAPPMQTLIDDLTAGRSGFVRTIWQGEDYFCVYNPLSANNGVLLSFVPAENLLSPALRSAKNALMSTERYVNTLLPFAALLTFIIVLFALIGSHRVVKPIKQLVEAVNKVGAGDFDVKVDIKTGDELEQLGDAFNAVIPQLKEFTKVQEELTVARAVQQRLLPHSTPNFTGIEIAGRTLYADQTGGDYYDFFELNREQTAQTGIVLGDVAGHGIAAALLMATVRALLHGAVQTLHSPAAVLSHINENLADDMHAGQFMTLFYLQFDPISRRVTWADAGHDPAIIYDPSNDQFSELVGEDIPLGVEAEWRYQQDRETTLTDNAIVLLGTDGIWETKSPDGEHFGKERLRESLRRLNRESVAKICDQILITLDNFRGSSKQRDDVSIVIFRPQQQPPNPTSH